MTKEGLVTRDKSQPIYTPVWFILCIMCHIIVDYPKPPHTVWRFWDLNTSLLAFSQLTYPENCHNEKYDDSQTIGKQLSEWLYYDTFLVQRLALFLVFLWLPGAITVSLWVFPCVFPWVVFFGPYLFSYGASLDTSGAPLHLTEKGGLCHALEETLFFHFHICPVQYNWE